MPSNNLDIFKLATDYMAMREKFTLKNDVASQLKGQGTQNFSDLFSENFQSTNQADKSLSWIKEYEDHLRYLIENDGSPAEIDGTTNIIQQLRLQKVERAMYEALGLNDKNNNEGKPKSIFEALKNFTDAQAPDNNLTAGGASSLLLAQSL